MKFRYTGEAPEGSINMYGATFIPNGEAAEVTNPVYIEKLLRHPLFEAEGAATPVSDIPKKRGRPPKVATSG